MNVRSIQHPGVETREIDLSEYFSSPAATSINNAYVMGFTQKGPIYDCSWITSQAEFIAVYGEPKTEAERYLYYAVQSILANGGNAIVSRMPYDNKQCKTYKGLSLTYGTYDGQLGVYNTVNDTASALLPLSQIKTFIGNNVKDDGLSSYIFPKFTTVEVTEQKPKGYLLWQDLSVLSATINDVELLANPPFFREYALGMCGTSISKAFRLEKVYTYLTTEYTIDDFKLLYKGFKKFFSKETLKAFNNQDKSTGLYFNFSQIEYVPKVPGGYYYNAIAIKQDASVNSEVKTSVDTFNKVFAYTTPGFVETGWGHYTAISGGNVYHPSTYMRHEVSNEALSSYYPSFDLCKLTVSDLIINLCPTFNDVIDYGDEVPFYRGEKPNYIDYLYSCLVPSSEVRLPSSDTEIEEFFTRNSESGVSEDMINARTIIPNMAASAVFTLNGISPSAVGVNFSAVSGLYNVVSGGQLLSAAFPPEIALSSAISSMITPSGSTTATSLWKAMMNEDTYGILDMIRVYNDPMFYNFNDEAIASVDAALMNDPAVGYENMVALVSKDVELTNEQYDNLVTTNNFQCEPDENYGEKIDSANFMIVDKLKTVTAGSQNNEGYFVTIIDPFDGLKMQRLLVNPFPDQDNYEEITDMKYWGVNSNLNWGKIYDTQINTLDTLARVKNADGIWVGEPGYGTKTNIMDSWSVPLTGTYTSESISKILMQSFRQIPITSAGSDSESCIDKCYSTHIVVAVCRTGVNPSDGKITVNVVETFFGSLFDEYDESTGASLYIGNLINQSSNYIEFYKNRYVQPKFGGAQSREPYNKTTVNQFFLKGSSELKDAAAFIGVNTDEYDVNQDFYPGENMCFKDLTEVDAYVKNRINDPAVPPVTGKYYYLAGAKSEQILYKELIYDENRTKRDENPIWPYYWTPVSSWKKTYEAFVEACAVNNVYIFDKKATCLYNLYQNAYFTSFSQKESQKVIANTTGIYSPVYGVSKKVASNFVLDMDRCIKFIDNVDEIPIYFVADAGLSTIAQFVDNINWDSANAKWITQSFDPDNDPDIEDHAINSFDDVATWKKVTEKLNYISESVRRDCMTIIDAPRQLTLDGQAPKLRPSAWDNNFDDEIGKKLRFISGLNSSYTAGYYNWVRTVDDFTGIAFWLPPTCKIIGNLVYLNSVNLPWLAPAGTMYGRINGIHAISHNPNSSEENQIYLKNWNYIKQYPVEGFIVEGQKTTLTRNSAFSRINVRTLFLDIERFVTNVGRNFRYKVNNQFTREQFIQTIKPKLEDYTVRQGITEYLIRCDETLNTPEVIDNGELRAIIYIKPGRLIEYIIIDAVCTKSGAVLAEVTY